MDGICLPIPLTDWLLVGVALLLRGVVLAVPFLFFTGFDCLGNDQSSFRLSALSLFSLHQWIVANCGIHKWYVLAILIDQPGHSVKIIIKIVCMAHLDTLQSVQMTLKNEKN